MMVAISSILTISRVRRCFLAAFALWNLVALAAKYFGRRPAVNALERVAFAFVLGAASISLLLYFLALLRRVIVRRFRTLRSQSWPWAETVIEHGAVKRVSKQVEDGCLLTVSYSYSISGERHRGVYIESFDHESEAQAVLDSLRGVPPPTRYNPSNPSKSVMDPYRDAALAVTSHSSEDASC